MVECSFTNVVVVSSTPVAVTETSYFAPVSSKEFLDIQATIECGFILKRVRNMIRIYTQIWLFAGPNQLFLTFSKICLLGFLEIIPNDRH